MHFLALVGGDKIHYDFDDPFSISVTTLRHPDIHGIENVDELIGTKPFLTILNMSYKDIGKLSK